jgi:hypothetical protein
VSDFTILSISKHPELLSSFLVLLLSAVCCVLWVLIFSNMTGVLRSSSHSKYLELLSSVKFVTIQVLLLFVEFCVLWVLIFLKYDRWLTLQSYSHSTHPELFNYVKSPGKAIRALTRSIANILESYAPRRNVTQAPPKAIARVYDESLA